MLYEEFRKKVMLDALEIIDKRHCSRFQILGYKYLDIKLILYYDDCNEVFLYQLLGDETEITRKRYYTSNHTEDDLSEQSKQFKANWDKDKIEEGKTNNVYSFK